MLGDQFGRQLIIKLLGLHNLTLSDASPGHKVFRVPQQAGLADGAPLSDFVQKWPSCSSDRDNTVLTPGVEIGVNSF